MQSIKELDSVAAVGSIITSLSAKCPSGYLRLEGQKLKIGEYTDLYNAIAKNNSYISTINFLGMHYFYLPDLRGKYLRHEGSNHPLASFQADAMRNITGRCGIQDNETYSLVTAPFYYSQAYGYDAGSNGGGGYITNFDASLLIPTSDEHRPHTMYAHFYIKY